MFAASAHALNVAEVGVDKYMVVVSAEHVPDVGIFSDGHVVSAIISVKLAT